MSIEDLSIFWYLRFLSSKTWNFCHADVSFVWLELSQDILYCLRLLWKVFPWFLSQSICHLYVEGLLDILELILYLATWKFISNVGVPLVEVLGSLMYTIISSTNYGTLTSSFPICILFISSGCFIALTTTSNTILNR